MELSIVCAVCVCVRLEPVICSGGGTGRETGEIVDGKSGRVTEAKRKGASASVALGPELADRLRHSGRSDDRWVRTHAFKLVSPQLEREYEIADCRLWATSVDWRVLFGRRVQHNFGNDDAGGGGGASSVVTIQAVFLISGRSTGVRTQVLLAGGGAREASGWSKRLGRRAWTVSQSDWLGVCTVSKCKDSGSV